MTAADKIARCVKCGAGPLGNCGYYGCETSRGNCPLQARAEAVAALSPADQIAAARALIEPLTVIEVHSVRANRAVLGTRPIDAAQAAILEAAASLDALTDLADALAQENARLRGCFEQIEEAALNGCLTPDLVAQITRKALRSAP